MPNVSLCVNENEVHYNPYVPEIRVVAKYNVTSTSSPTPIVYNQYISGFSEIEIDGVVQPSVVSAYTFTTTGEHTVKYTLTDPTSIGMLAFNNCTGMTSCTIGSSVTSIGEGAFAGCSGLTSIIIPSGVTSIGRNAFAGCSGLTSIIIPSGVTSIGDGAFHNSISNIESIEVSPTNTIYDSRDNCNAIIETSTNTLLYGCKSTAIPDSVTSIGHSAFYDCTGMTSVDIPDSVTSIGNSAFDSCRNITSIDIPSGVTSIGNTVFSNCNSLTSIDIPNSVTSIGQAAFYNCRSLTSIDIPNSVTSIGNGAFNNCILVLRCTIGSGVTSIGSNAFRDLTHIQEIMVNAITPPTLVGIKEGKSTLYTQFYYTNNCPIYVPSESVNIYKSTSGWSYYASRIQAIP